MATIIKLEEIKQIVKDIDLIDAMQEGFIQYSNGNTVVPPVGELVFTDPPGDTHIKYGYIKNQDHYVIKIASGFYNNPQLGLPSSMGLMLLFSQKTGLPKAILLDEGYLTDIRTAAAGALAAKYFAPQIWTAIGIIGTGIQAKLQLEYLQKVNLCKEVWVWGRTPENVRQFAQEIGLQYTVHVASTASELAKNCNIIITTTPSSEALLKAKDICKGTHITAVGSDTGHKQELDSEILAMADLVIADSIPQSKSRGEIFKAVSHGTINEEKIIELGTAIQNKEMQRSDQDQITVVDLTGVAVQDIMIASAVYQNFNS